MGNKVSIGNIVIMHTTMGDIHFELFPEECPKSCENFTTHSKNGYYDSVVFHRCINDFMIQTGTLLVTVQGVRVFGEGSSQMSFIATLGMTGLASYPWRMQAPTPTALSSSPLQSPAPGLTTSTLCSAR